jgi:tetratricopeptide (TPR) repeat protein
VATARNNLGYVYKHMERYDDALAEYTAAMSIRTEFFGVNHAHTIASKQNMAELLRAMGDEHRALELQQDIIAAIELQQQQQDEEERQQHQPNNSERAEGASVKLVSRKGGGIVRPVDGLGDRQGP